MTKTANLPYSTGKEENREVTEYGISLKDGSKTPRRRAAENIAKSDLVKNPIPISELHKWKTLELELYYEENKIDNKIVQNEFLTPKEIFVHKVKSDIDSCISKEDFIRLLDKYSHLENDKNFRKDVVIKLNDVVICKQETLEQLNSVWKIFKALSVIEDPEDLLVSKFKQRRAEINKLTL